LCVGAGKVSTLVLQHFTDLRPKRLLVCNRDLERARGLAARFGGEPVAFDLLNEQLAHSDVIITSTGAAHPILTRRQIDRALKQRRYRAMFLLDLAVPRDVEPAVGDNEHIYLYNIDDLQSVVSSTQAQRTDAIDAARRVVARHVDTFVVQQRQRAIGPAINLLYERSHALAREELERSLAKLPELSGAQREQLEELTRRIVNKLLHDPVTAMRDGESQHPIAPQYLHAFEKLFHLDDDGTTADDTTSTDKP
jgi:glutamyl-tRNA reductase